jgi:hypothetical protein
MQHTPSFVYDMRAAYLNAALQTLPERLPCHTLQSCLPLSIEKATANVRAFIEAAAMARVDVELFPADSVGRDLWRAVSWGPAGFCRDEYHGGNAADLAKLWSIACKFGHRYAFSKGPQWGISF